MKRAIKYLIMIISVMVLTIGTVYADSSTQLRDKVTQVVSEVTTSGMSERDKALALHDWLTEHAYYDMTLSRFEPEDVLLHGTGVCESYAKAYQLLLEKAGIECMIMYGTAQNDDGTTESHAWNLIKVDGVWGQVDVTWDDPVDQDAADYKIPKSGLENHTYFLAKKSLMEADHFPDEESSRYIEELVEDDDEADEASLPSPVNTDARIPMPDFEFETADGKKLTKAGYGKGKKMLIVYGGTTCGNTLAFMNGIAPYIDTLKKNDVTVLLALYDDPAAAEMKEMADTYPGIVCAKLTDSDNSMWDALEGFGHSDNYVTFPVIVLKNAQNFMKYYSVGYVEEPLHIVAGALQMKEDEAQSAHTWDKGTITKKPTCTKPGKKTFICSDCGETKTVEVKAAGHKWASTYTVDKKATYAKKGSKSIHCKVCDAVKPGSKKSIPKLKVKATTLTKVPAAKKAFTVKWKKGKNITGYQIQYALNKKFTKGKKTITIKKRGTTSKKIKKLKGGKKYWVRIRTYKNVSGKKYYSKWSKPKTVITKKK